MAATSQPQRMVKLEESKSSKQKPQEPQKKDKEKKGLFDRIFGKSDKEKEKTESKTPRPQTAQGKPTIDIGKVQKTNSSGSNST